MCIRFRWK